MPTEAELDDLVLSRHRTTLKLAWEAELREDLEDGGDDDAAYRVASMSEADRAEATSLFASSARSTATSGARTSAWRGVATGVRGEDAPPLAAAGARDAWDALAPAEQAAAVARTAWEAALPPAVRACGSTRQRRRRAWDALVVSRWRDGVRGDAFADAAERERWRLATAIELPELGRQQDWREAREAGDELPREWAAAGRASCPLTSADAPSSSASGARAGSPGRRPPAVGGRWRPAT